MSPQKTQTEEDNGGLRSAERNFSGAT